MKKLGLILLLAALALSAVLAQRGSGRSRSFYGGGGYGEDWDSARTARDVRQHGDYETPNWTNATGFERDVFTFVRIRRDSGYRDGGPWWVDAPDSDLNLSYRLQQTTSLNVDPDGRFIRLTDSDLTDYPFIYMVEPGSLLLSLEEATALRNYLLNGGFLMMDDFWGQYEWDNMEREMKKVFADRSFEDLPIDHPLYHCVFDIKEKAQCPNVENGTRQQGNPNYPIWERGDSGRQVHHRVIRDDKGRIVVFAAHNTDNGDGWEWEGNNHYYFEHFAEKIAYPLAINVIFYAMTH